MPTISMFYGIIIRMYYFDNQQHNLPHIHVHFQGHEAIIEIPTGTLPGWDHAFQINNTVY